MRLRPLAVDGAFVVEPERHADERGYFARAFDADAFAEHGLESAVAQTSVSFNVKELTLRGLHYQAAPHAEAKLVRCTRGAVYDVVVDLRPQSPTFLRWDAVQLDEDDGLGAYVPPGCAHGFLTLRDASELHYQISAPYQPEAARGVRWDDPAFGIDWPAAPRVIAARDASYPDFAPDR